MTTDGGAFRNGLPMLKFMLFVKIIPWDFKESTRQGLVVKNLMNNYTNKQDDQHA